MVLFVNRWPHTVDTATEGSSTWGTRLSLHVIKCYCYHNIKELKCSYKDLHYKTLTTVFQDICYSQKLPLNLIKWPQKSKVASSNKAKVAGECFFKLFTFVLCFCVNLFHLNHRTRWFVKGNLECTKFTFDSIKTKRLVPQWKVFKDICKALTSQIPCYGLAGGGVGKAYIDWCI